MCDCEHFSIAEGYGSMLLLYKMKLFSEMILAILQCVNPYVPQSALRLRKRTKKPSLPSVKIGKHAIPKYA
jgi:hypothetical protein